MQKKWHMTKSQSKETNDIQNKVVILQTIYEDGQNRKE